MSPETTAYFAPILEAAALLRLRVHTHDVERLGEVLDKISRGYPGDVMPPIEALRALTSGSIGDVEELALLSKVWPDWSGDRSFRLTATSLRWCWSSKHSGRYATITLPFPTALPLTVTVERHTDMDDQANHADECDMDDCNCSGFVEQTVSATVTEWNEETALRLGQWLSSAVIEEAKPVTIKPTHGWPRKVKPRRRKK